MFLEYIDGVEEDKVAPLSKEAEQRFVLRNSLRRLNILQPLQLQRNPSTEHYVDTSILDQGAMDDTVAGRMRKRVLFFFDFG